MLLKRNLLSYEKDIHDIHDLTLRPKVMVIANMKASGLGIKRQSALPPLSLDKIAEQGQQ